MKCANAMLDDDLLVLEVCHVNPLDELSVAEASKDNLEALLSAETTNCGIGMEILSSC